MYYKILLDDREVRIITESLQRSIDNAMIEKNKILLDNIRMKINDQHYDQKK